MEGQTTACAGHNVIAYCLFLDFAQGSTLRPALDALTVNLTYYPSGIQQECRITNTGIALEIRQTYRQILYLFVCIAILPTRKLFRIVIKQLDQTV